MDSEAVRPERLPQMSSIIYKPQDCSDPVFVTLLVRLLEKSSISQMGHELANWAVRVCVCALTGQLASVLDSTKCNHQLLSSA